MKTIMEFGFISFIGDHTLGVAIVAIVLLILYKIFVKPIVNPKKWQTSRQNNQVITREES